MAKTAASSGGSQSNRTAGRFALALAVAAVIAFFFLSTMLLFVCGMAPTLAAYMIDTNPRKYAAKTVGVLNLAGCIPVAADLWAGGQTVDYALELLVDPINWLIMLGAAAVGWLLYFSLPPIVGTYLSISFDGRIKSAEEKQKTLVKEWGTDVAQRAPVDDLIALEEDEKLAKKRAAKAKKNAKLAAANANGTSTEGSAEGDGGNEDGMFEDSDDEDDDDMDDEDD